MRKEIKTALPYWVLCSCLRCCRNKFFNASNEDFDDVFMCAYIGILEGLKNDEDLNKYDFNNKNIGKEAYRKLLKYGSKGVRGYFLGKNRHFKKNLISIDEPTIINEKKSKIAYKIPVYDFYNFDYSCVVDLLEKELINYSSREKEIIKSYVNGLTKQDIIKKFKITFEDLGILFFRFRKRFKDILLKNGIVDFSFDNTNEEFLSRKVYQEKERQKELQSCFVYGRDIKIIKLLKQVPAEEVCSLLKISFERYDSIINHKVGQSKFWLYQIQKIRKQFFSEYTLEELLEVF